MSQGDPGTPGQGATHSSRTLHVGASLTCSRQNLVPAAETEQGREERSRCLQQHSTGPSGLKKFLVAAREAFGQICIPK